MLNDAEKRRYINVCMKFRHRNIPSDWDEAEEVFPRFFRSFCSNLTSYNEELQVRPGILDTADNRCLFFEYADLTQALEGAAYRTQALFWACQYDVTTQHPDYVAYILRRRINEIVTQIAEDIFHAAT